jgi:hypothetical protein
MRQQAIGYYKDQAGRTRPITKQTGRMVARQVEPVVTESDEDQKQILEKATKHYYEGGTVKVGPEEFVFWIDSISPMGEKATKQLISQMEQQGVKGMFVECLPEGKGVKMAATKEALETAPVHPMPLEHIAKLHAVKHYSKQAKM